MSWTTVGRRSLGGRTGDSPFSGVRQQGRSPGRGRRAGPPRRQGERPDCNRSRSSRAGCELSLGWRRLRRDRRGGVRAGRRRCRRGQLLADGGYGPGGSAAGRPPPHPWSAGTVHSVRLPSVVVSTEVVFGLPDECLSIAHDAGGSPTPYVAGRCSRPEGGPFAADARAGRASARPGLTLPERLGRFNPVHGGRNGRGGTGRERYRRDVRRDFVTHWKAAWNWHQPCGSSGS